MRWKLVPVEPTEDMIAANHCECGNAEERDGYITHDYTAMLAAAPPASQDEALVERVVDYLLETDGSFKGYGPAEYWPYMARAVLKMLEADHG